MAAWPVVYVDVCLEDGINANTYLRQRAEELGATCVLFHLKVSLFFQDADAVAGAEVEGDARGLAGR